MTALQHDQERWQALESELNNTGAKLARVAREKALTAKSLGVRRQV